MSAPTHAVAVKGYNAACFIGRLVVGGFYLYAGVENLLYLAEKVGYATFKGVPFPLFSVIVASCLLLIGGTSILAGYRPSIGVCAIILFLTPVTLMMHNFWSIADPQIRMIETHTFRGNVALIGSALLLLGVPQPWAWSLDKLAGTVTTLPAELSKVHST